MRLWQADSGVLLATFLALSCGEWIIYTPEGYYTGSSGAEHYILWRDGDDILPVGAFSERFRQPAQLQALLQGRQCP